MNATTLDLRKYGCPVCPQRFHTLADKKTHVRVNHSSTKKGSKS